MSLGLIEAAAARRRANSDPRFSEAMSLGLIEAMSPLQAQRIAACFPRR